MGWLLALLLAGVASAETSGGAGTSATVGSSGYRSISLFADADWNFGSRLDPYGWSNFTISRESRRLSLVGGATHALSKDWNIVGGLGFSVGRFDEADSSSSAFLLEAQTERRWEKTALGACWRLSA